MDNDGVLQRCVISLHITGPNEFTYKIKEFNNFGYKSKYMITARKIKCIFYV